MSNSYVWSITLNDASGNESALIQTLEINLIEASPDIEVIQQASDPEEQGGFVELLVFFKQFAGSFSSITNAISTFFKSTHGASINIEIKDGELHRFEAKNITSEGCDKALQDILTYLREQRHDQ